MAPRGKRSLKASPDGIEQAEAALVHLAQSKTVLADKLEISRASIHKFFAGQPVGYENFLKICGELKLSWQKIAELPQVEITEFKSDSSASDSQDYPTEPDPNVVGRESANTESRQEEGIVDSKFEPQAIQSRIEKILEEQANISREKLFGVEEYIAILRKYLQDKEGSWFISVVGSGGVGKTSVVEKLVREHTVESGFVDIAWVTAKKTYFFVENRSIRSLTPDIGATAYYHLRLGQVLEAGQIKENAKYHYDKSRQLFIKHNADPSSLVHVNLALSNLVGDKSQYLSHSAKNTFHKEEKQIKDAANQALKTGYPRGYLMALIKLLNLYLKNGKIYLAIKVAWQILNSQDFQKLGGIIFLISYVFKIKIFYKFKIVFYKNFRSNKILRACPCSDPNCKSINQ